MLSLLCLAQRLGPHPGMRVAIASGGDLGRAHVLTGLLSQVCVDRSRGLGVATVRAAEPKQEGECGQNILLNERPDQNAYTRGSEG